MREHPANPRSPAGSVFAESQRSRQPDLNVSEPNSFILSNFFPVPPFRPAFRLVLVLSKSYRNNGSRFRTPSSNGHCAHEMQTPIRMKAEIQYLLYVVRFLSGNTKTAIAYPLIPKTHAISPHTKSVERYLVYLFLAILPGGHIMIGQGSTFLSSFYLF